MAEFQKILDHPGIMLSDPMGPMASLQMARALSASGDRVKSLALYQNLLTLWKDADAEIPVVEEARAEYAKLLCNAQTGLAHRLQKQVVGMSL